MTIPTLGQANDRQRRCSRLLEVDAEGRETCCDKPAVRHVIWWWREAQRGESLDDCWDHGYCCPDHWAEAQARWSFAAAHALVPACGMPGSRCHFEENTCKFDGLDVTEPDRCLAVGVPVPSMVQESARS